MSFDLLHQLFEAQADARPEASAVVFGSQKLSYGALEKRANQIAHSLRSQGVGPADFVAMLLPRGIDAYATLLGILKSGAAYVPIDKDYPDERIGYILANSGAKVLVTTAALGARAFEYSGSVLRIDADDDTITAQSTSRVSHEIPISKNHPCYVIYTSGSTGKPKGVLVEHRNATHLVGAEAQIFGVKSSDRVYQGASLCFDLSVEEVWLAFNSGGTLVAGTPEVAHGGPELGAYLQDNGVTVLSCVPTLLRTFKEELPSLRLLIFGGEKCPDAIVSEWSHDGRRLVNTYGPTETTVIATYAELKPNVFVTIGKAVPGYQVYLLDDDLKEVAQGENGEICVAGEGVARGYIGLAETTNKVFVQNPFGEPGTKLYRTGDLGRFDATGNIEFMGRKDSQVKIRGFRVELSEIEEGLENIPGIRFAACILHERPSGAQKLIGYVQKELERSVNDARILEQLREKLPAYMIPSQIETLEKMPLLASGKIDRKALAYWTKNAASTNANVDVAVQDLPQTKNEKIIAGIWQQLFQIGVFSRNSDFFLDLGGHSLLGAQFVSELRNQPLFATASLADLYDHPSVARLAAVLDGRKQSTKAEPQKTRDLEAEKRRHFWAGFVQFPLLYVIYSFQAMQWVSPYLVFYYLIEHETPVLPAIGWSILEFIALFPALLLFNVLIKWLLLGRIKPGRHKLWGAYYLRWWLVQRLISSINLNYLHGTPLLCFYLRLLGVKIGKDVYLGSNNIKAFDLVTIGDNTSIDEDASIYGASVQDGELVIGPISIGADCFVGTWSTLKEGAVMQDGSRLEDLSLVLPGGLVPKNETWAGSPAAKAATQENERMQPPARSLTFRVTSIVIYSALVLLLPLISYLPLAPALALFMYIDPMQNLWLFLVALPFIGACFVLLLTSEVVAIKWLLLGRAKAGVYPVHGSFYVRHWVVERLLALSLEVVSPLHATVYLAMWYRALGAKLGRFVELSTATSITPDLLEICDGGTVADEASLGAPRVENGWMHLAATKIGKRAFVGNTAVVPAGISLGDGSLIGVLSLAPSRPEDAAIEDATWLGSPPRLLPMRQSSKSHGDKRTYEPSRKLRFARAFVEIFRVTLPPAGFMLVTSLVVIAATEGEAVYGLAPTLLALPLVYMLCVWGIALAGALAKWVLIGKYKPFEKPLWSNFIWRLEFVNALFEFLTAPIALDALQGTPFLAWYFRLLGARVGRCLYAESMGVLEFDLTQIGDYVALNEVAVLQTHLFEDRVLKASHVRVGDRCTLGNAAVALYDSHMKDGTTLEALSLLMKGEVLASRAHFAGLPARSVAQPTRVPSDMTTDAPLNPEINGGLAAL